VEKLRDAETTYVGKVYPVDSRAKISHEKESLATIYYEISQLSKLDGNDTFLVDCRRRGSHDFTSRDVGVEVGSRLEEETGATVDFESPRKTVVVQIFQDTAYVGVTDTVNLLTKEIKRFRKYAKGTRPFTRAEHKIREAFDEFGIEIGEGEGVVNGLNGLIIGIGKSRGIEGVCLLGQIKYVNIPQIQSSKVVLETLTELLGVRIDTIMLEERARRMEERIRRRLERYQKRKIREQKDLTKPGYIR